MLLLFLTLAVFSETGFCRDTKIVGGQDVTNRSEYAYQVSLQTRSRAHFCGGSIIDRTHILTAAHCCYGINNNINSFVASVIIEAGNLKLYDTNQHTVTRSVRAAYPHENYHKNPVATNDVCVVRVSTPFGNWTNNIQSINLANRPTPSGTNCVVSGWGHLQEEGQINHILQAVRVPIVNTHTCNVAYNNTILNGMICAGYEEGGKDACQGDSGGPLVCNSQLVGVVSWGIGCARPNFYGVYADVAHYYSWINNKVRNSSMDITMSTLIFFILPVQLAIFYI